MSTSEKPIPQPSYDIPPPQVGEYLHITTQNPINVESLRTNPDLVIYQHCHNAVLTITYTESGACTWISCVPLGVISGGLCCCVPFCVGSWKDVLHSCPNCRRGIAMYNRLAKQASAI
ncbi:hypothetical protein CPC16_006089 [Podila verticillata]|nr:hypothetical protein BGZ52_003748 [Haplosporangium bisporale]KAF9208367.1 hypothetical protein BGZ59_010677 [Podila verticillata]KAF9389051.1 hypothetical protein CPC16_006089 [Podila verticillata]KAI9232418.1 MAG: LITAF-like zinc ribbon domain-containing protein [Podila humilis]KFH63812.1 hypothetical protein MVEG_10505 [Podila verticillata NRRL 6337]